MSVSAVAVDASQVIPTTTSCIIILSFMFNSVNSNSQFPSTFYGTVAVIVVVSTLWRWCIPQEDSIPWMVEVTMCIAFHNFSHTHSILLAYSRVVASQVIVVNWVALRTKSYVVMPVCTLTDKVRSAVALDSWNVKMSSSLPQHHRNF